jgi:hypothetical protein
MSKRNLFEVGATLLGIDFVVLGFRLIAGGFLASLDFYRLPPVNGAVYSLLIWSNPAVFLASGLLLIAKARRWAARLFEPEEKGASSPPALPLSDLLRVGLMLLGAYFLVSNLPDLIRLAWTLAQDSSSPLNYSNISALSLVIAIAAALLFKSRWVADLLMPTPAGAESEGGSESEESLTLITDEL